MEPGNNVDIQRKRHSCFCHITWLCLSKSGPRTLLRVLKKKEKKEKKEERKKKQVITEKKRKAEQLWVVGEGNSCLMNQSWENNTIKIAACAFKEAGMSVISIDYYVMKCAV